MAGSVNKATILGRLTRDPEVRSTSDGVKVVNMTVATSERWKDRSGEQKERSEFHRVVIFNENLVRIAEQYLRKGSSVYLEGQLQTRKWTDQSGTEKFTTEVVLTRFKGELTLLGERPERRPDMQRPDSAAAQSGPPMGGPSDLDDPDSIPF